MNLKTKDWEIVSLRNKFYTTIKLTNLERTCMIWPPFSDVAAKDINSKTWEIQSILRTSTGQIFEIGDLINLHDGNHAITKIVMSPFNKIVIHFNRPDRHDRHNTILLENAAIIGKPITVVPEESNLISVDKIKTEDEGFLPHGYSVWTILNNEPVEYNNSKLIEVDKNLKFYSTKKAAIKSMWNYKILAYRKIDNGTVREDVEKIPSSAVKYKVYEIYQVSLNDGKTYTLGRTTDKGTVISFSIIGKYNEQCVVITEMVKDNVDPVKNRRKGIPAFITDDNVYMYPGDKYFCASKYWNSISEHTVYTSKNAYKLITKESKEKAQRFSIKENAEAWLGINEPEIVVDKTFKLSELERLVTGPHMRATTLIKILKEK